MKKFTLFSVTATAAFATTASASLFVAEFDGSDTWTNDVAAQLFSDPSDPTTQGLFIQAGSNLGPDNVIFGRDLSNESGEPALNPVTLTFDTVSVLGETDVAVEFAYDLDGFDSTDLISYDVFVDGSSFSTGTFGGDDAGVLSVAVPDGSSNVSLTLVLDQNGPSASFPG